MTQKKQLHRRSLQVLVAWTIGFLNGQLYNCRLILRLDLSPLQIKNSSRAPYEGVGRYQATTNFEVQPGKLMRTQGTVPCSRPPGTLRGFQGCTGRRRTEILQIPSLGQTGMRPTRRRTPRRRGPSGSLVRPISCRGLLSSSWSFA